MQITLKDVTHIYLKGEPQEVRALNAINLTLEGSGVVALIGGTGSGKSTLVQTLNGLIRPTSGEVLIDGEDIAKKRARLLPIRKRIGLVFQYPEHQLFEETVYEDIAFGPKNLKLTGEDVKVRVREALSLVGLDQEILSLSPFHLSGGQQRRVAIAGVLAMEPEVLILDEPTAGLDPRGRKDILGQIQELQREKGLLVLFATHRMEEAATLSNRILVMDRGELVLDGTPKEIFTRVQRLRELHLDVPPFTSLFHRLAEKGYRVRQDILTLREAREEILSLLGKGSGE